MDAYLRDYDRPAVKPRRRPAPGPAELDLFAGVESGADSGSIEGTGGALCLREAAGDPSPNVSDLDSHTRSRIEAVHDEHASKSRHWIERGKPIAVKVAEQHGKVTAEMFRAEAEKRGVLPPETEQRSLSYIAVMFRELCWEGKLRRRTRKDGSVVREYSKVQANHQVIYEIPARSHRQGSAA